MSPLLLTRPFIVDKKIAESLLDCKIVFPESLTFSLDKSKDFAKPFDSQTLTQHTTYNCTGMDLLSSKKLWWVLVPWVSCFCVISVSLLQQKSMLNVNIQGVFNLNLKRQTCVMLFYMYLDLHKLFHNNR